MLHLATRLVVERYRFVFPEHVWIRLSSEQHGRTCDYQRQIQGRFPVSLWAFLLEVGSVNLMDTHPNWPFTTYDFEDIR